MAEGTQHTGKKATVKTTAEGAMAKQHVSPLERWRMVGEAAYYRAQKRGFLEGNPIQDWLEAEKEIDARYTVDFSKMLTGLDPSELVDQLQKAFGGQFPGVDLFPILDSQRKNVEALTEANQRVFQGGRDIMTRQVEMLREAMGEATTVIKELPAAKSPKDAAAKQGKLVSRALEKGLDNLREATETATKANAEAFNAVSARVAKSLEELKELAQKLAKEQRESAS